MKLETLSLFNVRNFKEKTISFNSQSNIKVILGDNGSGKTTILKSIINNLTVFSLIYGGSFLDDKDLSINSNYMKITTKFKFNREEMDQLYSPNEIIEKDNIFKITTLYQKSSNFIILVEDDKEIDEFRRIMSLFNATTFNGGNVYYFDPFRYLPKEELEGPNSIALPKDSREHSLKGSIVDNKLVNKRFLFIKQWLINLDFKRLKSPSLENNIIFEKVTSSFNELFNPYIFEKVNDNGEILFRNKDTIIEIDRLSEGFKNIFIMIGEILFRMNLSDPENPMFYEKEAIVLIDEIDCHIHPKWQVKILKYLRLLFPNIQFIVTTHSPFVVSELTKEDIIKLEDVIYE